MQAELAEQQAEQHAELGADSSSMHEDLMILDGDPLIDLTEDLDDAPMAPPVEGHPGLPTAPLHTCKSAGLYQMVL